MSALEEYVARLAVIVAKYDLVEADEQKKPRLLRVPVENEIRIGVAQYTGPQQITYFVRYYKFKDQDFSQDRMAELRKELAELEKSMTQ